MERQKRRVKLVGQESESKKIERAVERAVGKALKPATSRARTQVVSFFDFIRERGVIGLAIGIVLGSAVTALVRSLVDDVINPLVGILLVEDDLSASTVHVGKAVIRWGNVVSTFLDFVIIALLVYIIFRVLGLEKLDKKDAKKADLKAELK